MQFQSKRMTLPALLRLLSIGFLIVGLAACNDKEVRTTMEDHAAEAQKAMKDMSAYSPSKHYNPLVVTDKVWTGSSATRMHRGMPLPTKYEADRGITLISSDPMSLADIASAIHVQTGIPVRIADVGGPAGSAQAANAATAKTGPTMPVAYEGPLSGLLEKVAGYFGVNWHYDGSIISVAKFETRVFVIEALPGTQSVSEGMQDDSGGGSSGSSGGGSSSSSVTQNSKFSIDFKYWDEMDQVLTSMLGGTGTVVSSPSIGTVTVTTTPEIMRSVSQYIAKENTRLSRQIAINVEIYSVSLTDGTDFNVSFNTVLNRLRNFGINYGGVTGPPSLNNFVPGATTGLNVAILNPFPFNSATSPSISTGSGQLVKGIGQVTDVFTALSTVGDVTKVARFPLVTLNNRPVSRRVGEDKGYVSNVTAANTTTGGTSTVGSTISTSTLHLGFSVQLTPRLLDDGRILLEYSLSIIDNKGLVPFTSAGATLQIPDTVNRVFVSQSVLKSGSMLLLGGAEEEDIQQNSQGVGDAFNYLLGGGTTSTRAHTMVYMAITPQVLEQPHSEQE